MYKFEIKVTPSVFIDSGEIHLKVQTEADKLYTEVMQTKDKATRAALIALGWTPPELKRYTFTVLDCEDDMEVDTYEILAESLEIAHRVITHIEKFDTDYYYRFFKEEEI